MKASEKMKAQLKLNYQKKKAEKLSGSGEIIPDDPSPPVMLAAVAPYVAPPVFLPAANFRFKLGDSVETRPDSQPGVRGYHGESFCGSVAALDYTTRLVVIKSCHDGHMHPAVHENRVYPVSRAINGIGMQDTRAATANPDVHLQRELEQKKKENLKHEITIAAMKARLDAFEEKQPAIRQITREMGVLAGEIQQLKTANLILRGEIRDSAQTTSAQQMFSRSGPSKDATPVMKAIRAIYMEKLFEGEERDEAAQQTISELNARIVELTRELRAEVKEEVELKREIRRLNGETKRQAKELEEHEVAAELDRLKNDFEDSLNRRLQYVSRCSAYTVYALMYEKYSRSFINKERRQLGIEQGIINAWKLASAKYYRQFFNDSSDKKGANIMCTSILVEYESTEVGGVNVRGETELLILSAADLPKDKTALGNFNSVQLLLEYLKEKLTKGLMLNYCIRAVICNMDNASLNGIVISQLGRLFKGTGNCCPEWNDRLTMYCMEFTKNKLYYFITQVAQK